jgi:hypothetical protein
LLLIAPGFSQKVAEAIIATWQRLGPGAVQIVMDPDPEVCRLGFGDFAALQKLHTYAESIGATIHQQKGLRVGVVITDETTTVYSPTPRLVESGGEAGEKTNAIRFDVPILEASLDAEPDLEAINLQATQLTQRAVQHTKTDLDVNPPLKFDLAQKMRVFNAVFEFVEFELRGLMIDKKTVRIPPDLMVLAKEPEVQKLLRNSFKLIGDDPEISGEDVVLMKNEIANRYLCTFPGYGSVILRTNKDDFLAEVKALREKVQDFQKALEEKLQGAINANREKLMKAILPSVTASPPARWTAYIGKNPSAEGVERMLRQELTRIFGETKDLYKGMKVSVVFKGVTYESLQDEKFLDTALKKLQLPDKVHEEFDAAKAEDSSQAASRMFPAERAES